MATKKNQFIAPVKFANEFVESRYCCSALELDLIVRIVRQVQYTKKTSLELKFSDVQNPDNKSNNAISEILKACKNLLSTPITIYDQDAHIYTMANILSGVRIYRKTQRIQVNLDPFLLPYLHDVAVGYTTIELNAILAMRSIYAKRIYMMAAQFRSTKVLSIALDELRQRLELGDKYQVYNDLKKRVIAPALEQINKLSELNIAIVDVEHDVRRVERINFKVHNKNEFEAVVDDNKQIQWLIRCGLSNWQIENCYICKTPAELRPILYKAYLRIIDKNKPAIENKAAYLVTILAKEGINMRGAMPRQLAIPG